MDVHEFPILYGLEKNGKEKVWQASVKQDQDKSVATITYGQLDGKKTVITREYTTGKNIGKANETSPYQQCFLETERKWKDKLEKESYTTKDVQVQYETKIFPMLASTYSMSSTKKKDIVYPCMAQPKLDGLRCIMYLSNGIVRAQSRTGGYFESLMYLTESTRDFFLQNPDLVLDGELYTMDMPFETLAGLIKKKHLTDTDRALLQQHVKYHVYDIVSEEPFLERNRRIKEIIWTPYIEPVTTVEVENMDEFKSYYSKFIEQGYEGIMLRNTYGLYTQGFRSHELQKYKEFQEEEYPIVGFEEGEGRDLGCVIWVCSTSKGKLFRVRPRGTMEQRRDWFKKGEQYIDTQLTVIYQELSEQGVPRFPVGKAFREGY